VQGTILEKTSGKNNAICYTKLNPESGRLPAQISHMGPTTLHALGIHGWRSRLVKGPSLIRSQMVRFWCDGGDVWVGGEALNRWKEVARVEVLDNGDIDATSEGKNA